MDSIIHKNDPLGISFPFSEWLPSARLCCCVSCSVRESLTCCSLSVVKSTWRGTRETCQGSDTSAASSASAACLARRALQSASSNAVNVSKSQNEGCQRGVLASSSSCCKACQSYVRLTLARTAKQLLVTLASTYASNAASNVDAPNVSKCIQMYPNVPKAPRDLQWCSARQACKIPPNPLPLSSFPLCTQSMPLRL